PIHPAVFERLAVEGSRLHIDGLCRIVYGLNLQFLSVAKGNMSLFKKRTSKLDDRTDIGQTLHIEKSQRGNHIPRTQLSLIFVLPVTVTMNTLHPIKFIQNGAGPALGQIRLARKIKQPADMKAWLIAMVVNGIHAGKGIDFFTAAKTRFLSGFEDSVQAGIKFVLADF